MISTVLAVYEDGVLKPQSPLALPEKQPVLIPIRSEPNSEDDAERRAWLQLSEQSLLKSWADSDDDCFNELLKK